MLKVTNLIGFGGRSKALAFSYLQTAVDETNDTTYTFSSHNFGAEDSARRIVIVVQLRPNSTTCSVTSATIGGVSASLLVEAQNGFGTTSIWQAAVPTGTSGTVVVNIDNLALAMSIGTYRLVNAAATAHATATDATGDPTSISINCPAGGAIIGGDCTISATSGYTWTGITERSDDTYSSTNGVYTTAGDRFDAAQTSLSITCDAASNITTRNLAVVSFAPG